MNKIFWFVLAGIVVAIIGMFISEFFENSFNGMDYGSASVLGFCIYLCIVIVTCTGIIVLKLDEKQDKNCKN